MTENITQPLALFLMGPTASGKTGMALSLCSALQCARSREVPVEIISVDSALIYRGMDIGTAKPSQGELITAPHHLIDIRDPAESYSAAEFRHDALHKMAEIVQKGRIPLLVGGTMLYFKALLEGISPLPPSDPAIREQIEQQAVKVGWQRMHEHLQSIDPVSAARIHPNDPQRVARALEVFLISGKTLTELTQIAGEPLPYRVYQFAIAPATRAILHQRIEQRFGQMLATGFEQEVRALLQRGDLNENMPSVRCVGYRQMWAYIRGEIEYNEMVYRGICATRQLAKRQMTWLRGWPEITWLDSDQPKNGLAMIKQVLGIQ